jgi:hypothetical protein
MGTMIINNLTLPNPDLFCKNKMLSASTAGTFSNDLMITTKYSKTKTLDWGVEMLGTIMFSMTCGMEFEFLPCNPTNNSFYGALIPPPLHI